jgi:hypothetical protein
MAGSTTGSFEREDRVGERVDDTLFGGIGVVALEDRIDEGTVDWTPLAGQKLGQLLPALRERGGAVARPHERVEREPRHSMGMPLCEQRRAQRAGRNAVRHEAPDAVSLLNVVGCGDQIVGAVGDVAEDVALLVRAAIAFHVDRPADKPTPSKPIHDRRVRPARNAQVEGGLRRHRRSMDEQHGGLALRRSHVFFP